MWKYSNQIKIRWLSFIVGLMLIALIILFFRNEIIFSQTGIKVFLGRFQILFENLPIWIYALIVLVSIGIMYAGLPSVCVVLPLMLLKNCTFAYIIAIICQFTASLLAMWQSYKSTPAVIPEELKKKLEANKDSFQSFAFWSRLYYNIPLRTIDQLTPLIHNNEECFYNSLIPAASAIMIRICIPTLLLKHIIDQFTVLEPNPELEHTKLIIWGIVLIIYTVIPKVPELMICPKKVKKVIFEIESPSN
ncbi:MAG: hypothetical protein IKO19_13185 [Candidatus Riflebacteria bacterium]|nr:hypothetical protein [Candidatus Riflebacteria bacterium]